MDIILAETDAQVAECFPIMAQLQPQMAEAEFAARVRLMHAEGFRLARLSDGGQVRAVAGFRLMEKLFSGRILYLEDIVTDKEFRSQGFGSELMDWLCDYARLQQCTLLKLNSGVQMADAHRFYFARRMRIASFHFSLPLGGVEG